MVLKKEYKEVWEFTYRGINCEIVHWGKEMDFKPQGIWNGYIYILKQQLPKDFEKLLCRVKRYKKGGSKYWDDYYRLEKYFDMHGGITFYTKERNEFNGEVDAIRVGCDYAHIWDEDRHYDENDVENDLKHSVDTFISNFPDYLVWNPKDGSFIKPKD